MRETFTLYEGSRMRDLLMIELSAQEMVMPRLHDWLVTALNRHNVTITTALTHGKFHLLDRQRLKHWQARFNTELAAVEDLLISLRPLM